MVKIKGIYKHFKWTFYIVEDIAKDSETLEETVIYRDLTDTNKLWVRSLSEFESLVDKKKYPDVKQKNRFELVKEIYND